MAPKTQQIHDIKRQLNSWELSPGETELGGRPEAVSHLVSQAACQAGGPRCPRAIGRRDTEQAWGSPPGMILSFRPQPRYNLETPVLVTTERGV